MEGPGGAQPGHAPTDDGDAPRRGSALTPRHEPLSYHRRRLVASRCLGQLAPAGVPDVSAVTPRALSWGACGRTGHVAGASSSRKSPLRTSERTSGNSMAAAVKPAHQRAPAASSRGRTPVSSESHPNRSSRSHLPGGEHDVERHHASRSSSGVTRWTNTTDTAMKVAWVAPASTPPVTAMCGVVARPRTNRGRRSRG